MPAGKSTNILGYDDAADVAEWAISALQWACGAGVISGTWDNYLLPRENATCAQMAAILMRMLKQG